MGKKKESFEGNIIFRKDHTPIKGHLKLLKVERNSLKRKKK